MRPYSVGAVGRTSTRHADQTTVPRMQFYAIEIARNRAGLNDWIYEANQKEEAAKKAGGKP